MVLSIILVLLLFFISTTQAAIITNAITSTPPYIDEWCEQNCNSLSSCNELYQSNSVDLRLRVRFPIDNVGSHLIQDKYLGTTISRQIFTTQFILDIANATNRSPCRLYVLDVFPEGTDNYWDSESVFISFRLFPADASFVTELTRQIQQPNSALYDGHVTHATDSFYSLVIPQWDHSLKLMYSTQLVGDSDDIDDSEHERYLNQGSLQTCAAGGYSIHLVNNTYCKFEKYLTQDLERALDLQPGQFVVLFIKEADRHSVIVSFRLIPEVSMNNTGQDIAWVESKVTELVSQIADSESLLYSGNVSFKIDPTWGISGKSKQTRQFSKYLSQPAPSTSTDAYERCKATKRCPRAWNDYNQSLAVSSYTFQEYLNGEHVQANAFSDFEDWRVGIRGWEQSCRNDGDNNSELCLPVSPEESNANNKKPTGAHWSPFVFDALGPTVQASRNKWNQGLVLNEQVLKKYIADQTNVINQYEYLVAWLDEEYQYGVTNDVMLRSREEIRANITNYTEIIQAEKQIEALTLSQCSNVQCSLLFNTSDAALSGAVNATGVITATPDGTEVALWAFDSIDLDEHVNITLTGQRAMALVSRSSVRINTTLHTVPGTLGGFPGGFSVARHERLNRVCDEGVDSRQFLDVCPGDVPISELSQDDIISNNINGPGSPSTRVYLMTIETAAPIRNEIQSITVTANKGQTLSGSYRLHFNGYTTPHLPHDITASQLKRKIQDSLNPVKTNQLNSFARDEDSIVAGIGTVDVTKESFGSSGGSQWRVAFASSIGNIGEDSSHLTATSHLVSRGARVDIETIQHGNSIGGTFSLQFLGNETRFIPHDVTAQMLEDILLQDISSLSTVHVLRSDPTNNCNDGHCNNGAGKSGGYTYTLTLTTQVGNTYSYSPTSSQFDEEGDIANMTAVNRLSGCIDSQCPTIQIDMGHSKSQNTEMRSIDGSKPFSLAYGGAGAGHGGVGGQGFTNLPLGQVYGDEQITNLYGGSGGSVGVAQPFQLGIFKRPRFRGGSGGGALEIVATNDIIIGSNAILSYNGESGADGYMSAGGGGSGGTILLAAGGVVQVDGKLSVAGGDGGNKRALPQVESFGGHGGGGSGGRVALYGQSVVIGESSTILLDGGNCSDTVNTQHNCTGGEGTLYIEAALEDTELMVDNTIGAEGTRSSLHLKPRRIPFNSQKLSTRSAPEFDLGTSTRPNRISFYYRVERSSSVGWDATFEFREKRYSYLSNNNTTDDTTMIGFVMGKGQLRHGVNFYALPFDDIHVKNLNTIKSSIESNKWIKIDIRFNWQEHTHDVYVDDVRLVFNASFLGESMRVLSISNYYEGGKVWFDEIYVGDDTTKGFHCPVVKPNGTFQMDRPLVKGWKLQDIGDDSSLRSMQRHESHVSRRAVYQREDNKFVVPFDGSGEREFTSDVKFRSKDGDRIHEKGQVLAGSLLRLPRDQHITNEKSKVDGQVYTHGIHPNTYMWFGDHDYFDDPRQVSGAVMACSTQDFTTWRNEGVMLHYANITDMVNGPTGPNDPSLHVEKPKVIYNNITKQYVMWMIIDNGIRELGLTGVAVSDYPNGPFAFIRSFYPDGNQTRDQTLFQDDDGTAYLFRTFYDNVEYVIPQAVMQPTWESVKNDDGSTNFALSYHRAEYHPGYDDYHDIYKQRWTTEDQPWKVICVNRLTKEEREVPYGEVNYDGDVCQDPFEYKKVLGQGNPTYENSKDGIQSRFLDPNDPANNAWIPNSVPSVKGQPWKANYEEGVCGKRKINGDMQHYDPNLPFREEPNRGNCSNIVDNPIHPTLADKRIGPQTVTERRRAKYIAISRLAEDYLDTSGIVKVLEGELSDGADLSSLVGNPFGWKTDDINIDSSTFQPQVHDDKFAQKKQWEGEHHHFKHHVNDKSFYSSSFIFDAEQGA